MCTSMSVLERGCERRHKKQFGKKMEAPKTQGTKLEEAEK